MEVDSDPRLQTDTDSCSRAKLDAPSPAGETGNPPRGPLPLFFDSSILDLAGDLAAEILDTNGDQSFTGDC
jgi:hypothetical protein